MLNCVALICSCRTVTPLISSHLKLGLCSSGCSQSCLTLVYGGAEVSLATLGLEQFLVVLEEGDLAGLGFNGTLQIVGPTLLVLQGIGLVEEKAGLLVEDLFLLDNILGLEVQLLL